MIKKTAKFILMRKKESRSNLDRNKKAGQNQNEDHTREEKKEVIMIDHRAEGLKVTIEIHTVGADITVEKEKDLLMKEEEDLHIAEGEDQDLHMTEVPEDDMTEATAMRGGNILDHLAQGRDLLRIDTREIREDRRSIRGLK